MLVAEPNSDCVNFDDLPPLRELCVPRVLERSHDAGEIAMMSSAIVVVRKRKPHTQRSQFSQRCRRSLLRLARLGLPELHRRGW